MNAQLLFNTITADQFDLTCLLASLDAKVKELAFAEAQVRLHAIQQEIESIRYEIEQLNRDQDIDKARRQDMNLSIQRLRQGGVNGIDRRVEEPEQTKKKSGETL